MPLGDKIQLPNRVAVYSGPSLVNIPADRKNPGGVEKTFRRAGPAGVPRPRQTNVSIQILQSQKLTSAHLSDGTGLAPCQRAGDPLLTLCLVQVGAPPAAVPFPEDSGQTVEMRKGHVFEIKIQMKMKKGRDCELSLKCDQDYAPIATAESSEPTDRCYPSYSPGSLFLLASLHLVKPKNQRRCATGFWGCLKI